MNKVSHRYRREMYCFHAAVRGYQLVQLHSHLTSLRRVEPASIVSAFDVALDIDAQLQKQTQALVLVSSNPGRKKVLILRPVNRCALSPMTVAVHS